MSLLQLLPAQQDRCLVYHALLKRRGEHWLYHHTAVDGLRESCYRLELGQLGADRRHDTSFFLPWLPEFRIRPESSAVQDIARR